MAKRIVAPGDVFGRWTILEVLPRRQLKNRPARCRCACGREATRSLSSIVTGLSQSCGCLTDEMNTRHGASRAGHRTPEYEAWASMLKRCRNPKNSQYSNYGGRGITVCPEWSDFTRFLADVGPRPQQGRRHSLERINNELGYFAGNVKWATAAEQHRNKRSNVYLTAFGETLTISDWAERIGMSGFGLHHRITHGWPLERALTQPSLRPRGGRKP